MTDWCFAFVCLLSQGVSTKFAERGDCWFSPHSQGVISSRLRLWLLLLRLQRCAPTIPQADCGRGPKNNGTVVSRPIQERVGTWRCRGPLNIRQGFAQGDCATELGSGVDFELSH